MTTKDNFSISKDKQLFNSTFSDPAQQYSNLNLNKNQSSKCSNISPVLIFSNSNQNTQQHFGKIQGLKQHIKTITDSSPSSNSESTKINLQKWNKTTNFDSKSFISETVENEDKRKISNTTNNNNSSTLSLHITAYENSIVATSGGGDTVSVNDGIENKKVIKKWKISTPAINYSNYEFPRQQKEEENKDKKSKPEVMQFKASQRLFISNEQPSSSNSIPRYSSFTKKNDDPSSPIAGPSSFYQSDTSGFAPFGSSFNGPGFIPTTTRKGSLSQFQRAIDAIGSDDIVSNVQQRVANLGLRVNREGNFQGFGDYMHAKTSKLKHQVHSKVIQKSEIFKGISFYVDGLTHPPANEIRELVTENGGEYHHYYKNGTTTYFVAEALASTKVDKVRKEQKIIKPTFITDSIYAGRLLPVAEYYLLDKNNPGNHVNQFFDRSRLHLISTMAKELKQYVATMKENKSTHIFTGHTKLEHLKSSVRITVPIICHIDMDCFFVSVALRNRPDLHGKPIAITHSTAQGQANGEIASCSYEARAKGCYARQFVRAALQLCPNLICLPYQFDEYVKIAKQLYSIISTYTLQIQAVSCDELYFDLGSICQECDISDPLGVITIIRNDIFENTKCIASAGLGPNALIARMATKKAKPNGQYYVRKEDAQNFIGNASISDLPTVGWTTTGNIQAQFGADIKLCKQLFDFSIDDLRKVLGAANGEKVYHALRGRCEPLDFDSTVIDQKSVSVNVNFGIRYKNEKDLKESLQSISTELSHRLNAINKTGASLTLKLLIREPDAPIEPTKFGAHGSCFAIRKTYSITQTSDSDKIFNTSMKMIQVLKPVITDIRGVALHMTKLFTVGTVTTKKPGTIWNFMKIIAPTTTSDGAATKGLGAFEWVKPDPKVAAPTKKKKPPTTTTAGADDDEMDDSFYSPVKEQDEMRMKLTDIFKIYPIQKHTTVKNVVVPTPTRPSWMDKLGQPCLRQITRGKILINGLLIEYAKPPKPHHFRHLITSFKKMLSNTLDLHSVFEHLVRYVTAHSAREEWKPLIDSIKRYLNWYSHNRRGMKIFPFEEGPNDDEEFGRFIEDLIREIFPKKNRRRAPSPDIFDHSDVEEDEVMIVSENDDNEIEITDELINIPSSSQESNEECQILANDQPGSSTTSRASGGATTMPRSKHSVSGPSTSKPTVSKPAPTTSTSKPPASRTTTPTAAEVSNLSTSRTSNVGDTVVSTTTSGPSTSKTTVSKPATTPTTTTSKPSELAPKLLAIFTRATTPTTTTTAASTTTRTTPTAAATTTSKQNSSTSELSELVDLDQSVMEINVSNTKDSASGPSTSRAQTTTVSKTAATSKPARIPSRGTTPIATINEEEVDLDQSVIEINFTKNTSKSKDSGPSSSRAQTTTVSKAGGAPKSFAIPSHPTTTTTAGSKQNSSTTKVINDKPGPSSKPQTTTVSKAATTSKLPAPKPIAIPSRTTTTAAARPPTTTSKAAATTTKPKPSTSKKAAKKIPLKKQTSFDSGTKRKQPALEDLWNQIPSTKKKRTSLPAAASRRRQTINNDDDECIIEEDDDDDNDALNQSVIALN